MSASHLIPEAEDLTVVIVGAFNPAIFHPQWFLHHKLISDQEAEDAKIKLVSVQATDVKMRGWQLVCVSDRLSLTTSNISEAAPIQDFLTQLFTLLPHTPVTACGINVSAQFAVESQAYWHKIGHTLAPKELIWNDMLVKPE